MGIRIGNGCGFWGDNADAPILLAQSGRLNYLTLEYLAELTMSILALQKQRDPQAGFAGDFLDVLERLVPVLQAQPKLKIITNAGGMNPESCSAKAKAILAKGGLANKAVATVTGDDLLPHLDQLLADGHRLTNMDTGQDLSTIRDRVVSANAYLGAWGIVEALRQGADVVITGRVADASLTVAPAVHEFGWDWQHWNRLSAATVAGHLIECGAQVTGGMWCDWWQAPDLANVGYPIADIDADGSFIITKPENTGGAVNTETVAEQLLYEVGDPAAYLTPDVVADFASVSLAETGPNMVRVENARGLSATQFYKASIAYRDGYVASGTLVIAGPHAVDKARLAGSMILERVKRGGYDLERTNIECLGSGDCVPGLFSPATSVDQILRPLNDPPEVVLRVSAHDSRKSAIERFAKEFAPLVTSGPPGVTGYTTGRPPVREVFAYWPALIAKSVCRPKVEVHR
jgi:hypothetical protein